VVFLPPPLLGGLQQVAHDARIRMRALLSSKPMCRAFYSPKFLLNAGLRNRYEGVKSAGGGGQLDDLCGDKQGEDLHCRHRFTQLCTSRTTIRSGYEGGGLPCFD